MSDILIKRNHMKIPWHNYVSTRNSQPITEASLSEKASLIGRTGMMLLSCGTGAWRVRSSMNTLSEALGITCSADIGLMSINYTCFDGESSFSHALSLTTTGGCLLVSLLFGHFGRIGSISLMPSEQTL